MNCDTMVGGAGGVVTDGFFLRKASGSDDDYAGWLGMMNRHEALVVQTVKEATDATKQSMVKLEALNQAFDDQMAVLKELSQQVAGLRGRADAMGADLEMVKSRVAALEGGVTGGSDGALSVNAIITELQAEALDMRSRLKQLEEAASERKVADLTADPASLSALISAELVRRAADEARAGAASQKQHLLECTILCRDSDCREQKDGMAALCKASGIDPTMITSTHLIPPKTTASDSSSSYADKAAANTAVQSAVKSSSGSSSSNNNSNYHLVKVVLRNKEVAMQVLRAKKALKGLNLQVLECLSEDERALKRAFIVSGVVEKIWEEKGIISWRRGQLVRLNGGKWEMVPLPEKK